jgi:hypothetical protein
MDCSDIGEWVRRTTDAMTHSASRPLAHPASTVGLFRAPAATKPSSTSGTKVDLKLLSAAFHCSSAQRSCLEASDAAPRLIQAAPRLISRCVGQRDFIGADAARRNRLEQTAVGPQKEHAMVSVRR